MAANKGFEPSTPEDPRQGQYLPVTGYTDAEGGGELEVRLTPCKDCSAAVAETGMADHESWHAAQEGSAPKSK